MAEKTETLSKKKEDYVTNDPMPKDISSHAKGNASDPYAHETAHDRSSFKEDTSTITVEQFHTPDERLRYLEVEQRNRMLTPGEAAELNDLKNKAQGSLKQKPVGEAYNKDDDETKRESGKNLIDFLYEKYYEAFLYKCCDWGRDIVAWAGGTLGHGISSGYRSIREHRGEVKAKNKKIAESRTFDKCCQVRKIRDKKIMDFFQQQREEIQAFATLCNAIRNGSLPSKDELMEKFKNTVIATGNPEADKQIALVEVLCEQYASGASKKERSFAKKQLKAFAHDFCEQHGKKMEKEKMAFLAANDLTAATILKRLAENTDYANTSEDLQQAYNKQLNTDKSDIFNAARHEISGISPQKTILTKIYDLADKAYNFSRTEAEDGRFVELGEKVVNNPYIPRCNKVINSLMADPNSTIKTNPQVDNEYANNATIFEKDKTQNQTLREAAQTYRDYDEYIANKEQRLNEYREQRLHLRQEEPNRKQKLLRKISQIRSNVLAKKQQTTPHTNQQESPTVQYAKAKAVGHGL